MAIRLASASSQYIERTSNPLDYNADYTVMYWYYRTSAAAEQCMYEASAEATQSNHDDNYRITAGGACFIQIEGAGGSPSTTGSGIVQASVWSHVAMVRSGYDVTMYINGVQGATMNKDISTRTDPVVNNRIGVYYDNTLQKLMDGRVFAVKMWNTALSVAEIQAESSQQSPIRYANLWYWLPCNPGYHLGDWSANRYHWSEISSPTDEAGFDLPWPAIELTSVEVVAGDIAVTPSPIYLVTGKVDPAIELGSLSITPTVDYLVTATANPTVALGSLTITPASIFLVMGKVDSGVALSSLSITPAVDFLVTGKVDPTATLGSISITPTQDFLVTGKVDPTVDVSGGNVSLTPAPSFLVTGKVDSTVQLGSLSITPAVDFLVMGRVNPSATLGSLNITPTADFLVTGKVDPSILYGSTSVTPAPSYLVMGKTDPTVQLGSLNITPAVRFLVLGKVEPTVQLGSLTITPDQLLLVTGVVDPSAILGSINFAPAQAYLVTTTFPPDVAIVTPIIVVLGVVTVSAELLFEVSVWVEELDIALVSAEPLYNMLVWAE